MQLRQIKMWESQLPKEIIAKKYREFSEQILPKYPDGIRKLIESSFFKSMGYSPTTYVLLQIYSMYGIIPDEHNVYKWHLEKIKKEIGIELPVIYNKINKYRNVS